MLVRTTLMVILLSLFSGGAIPAVASAGEGQATTTPPAAAQAAEKPKEEKQGAEKVESWLKTRLAIAGLVIAALLVIAGTGLIVWVVIERFGTTLAVEPFGDGGVDAKVGTALTGMIQERLADLSERGSDSPGPYRLDLAISADVALLAQNESLGTALAGLADSSQFKLVVGLLALVDRKIGRHLVAKGELASPGTHGYGVILSLQSQKNGIESNGSLWDGDTSGSQTGESKTAGPYYGLAGRSAAWIQYEAARSLNSKVSLFTDSATSFSLMSEGLARQRDGDYATAGELYAEALADDPENVAALINLSALLANKYGLFEDSVRLLGLAKTALRKRYQAVV